MTGGIGWDRVCRCGEDGDEDSGDDRKANAEQNFSGEDWDQVSPGLADCLSPRNLLMLQGHKRQQGCSSGS